MTKGKSSTLDQNVNQKIIDNLNRIISTQSLLIDAHFNLESFMNSVVEKLQELTPATGAIVELVEGDSMVYKAAIGTVKQYVGLRLHRKNSISGLCVEKKEILRSDDTEMDVRVNIEACRMVGARSMVVAPVFHDNQVLGVLKITSTSPHTFNDVDVETLKFMAGLIGAALAKHLYANEAEKLVAEKTQALDALHKAKKQIARSSEYDELTGVLNRKALTIKLQQEIQQVKKNKTLMAIFMVNVDDFKFVNDAFGYSTGDEILSAIADRISFGLRQKDIVARFGVDGFIVMQSNLKNKEEAISVANDLLQKMRQPFVFHNTNIPLTLSIGVAFNQGEIEHEDVIIKNAESALKQAKQSGKNKVIIFES